MKWKKYIIVSEGTDEVDELIKAINRDEKTKYLDGDCFKVKDFTVEHHVLSTHNSLNLKRKYNQYQII